MNTLIDNSDDVIDSRDVIARIEELEGEREALADALDSAREDVADMEDDADPDDVGKANDAEDAARDALSEWDTDNGSELKALLSLQEQAEGYCSDWKYGATLIRDSHFQDYAQELAEELHGDQIRKVEWPLSCIDWKRAAEELQMDYTSVEFDGMTFWVR